MEVLDCSERRGCVLSVIKRVVGPSTITNTPEVGLVAKTEKMTTVVVTIRLLYFSERLDGSRVKASVDHIANRKEEVGHFFGFTIRCTDVGE